jgi:hypothetical protein
MHSFAINRQIKRTRISSPLCPTSPMQRSQNPTAHWATSRSGGSPQGHELECPSAVLRALTPIYVQNATN